MHELTNRFYLYFGILAPLGSTWLQHFSTPLNLFAEVGKTPEDCYPYEVIDFLRRELANWSRTQPAEMVPLDATVSPDCLILSPRRS